MTRKTVRFGYDLMTATEYELEIAEFLAESGLMIREEVSGPNGRHRVIVHREAMPEDHDRFDQMYHHGQYR